MTGSPPILIVEDNADDWFLLERSFGIANVQNVLRRVADGQQAIDYLQGSASYRNRTDYPLPSLVLLDLKLPFKHGFEVLAWLREQRQLIGIVVVILTSSSEDTDVSKAYELGANAYLVKPTSVSRLTEAVRALRIFWFDHNKFKALPSG